MYKRQEIPYAKESIKGNAQMGDFEYACYGYYGLMMAVMESAAHVEELWNEAQAGVKFAEKTGSDHALGSFLSFQQLCSCLLYTSVRATSSCFTPSMLAQ